MNSGIFELVQKQISNPKVLVFSDEEVDIPSNFEVVKGEEKADVVIVNWNQIKCMTDLTSIIKSKLKYSGFLVVFNFLTPKDDIDIHRVVQSSKVFDQISKHSKRDDSDNHVIYRIFDPRVKIETPQNQNYKVVCVMKRSKEFSERCVNLLAASVKQNLTVNHEFVALVDSDDGIDKRFVDRVVILENDYPSWWCKMELFRSDVFSLNDRILYFDLDTAITGNIDFFFEKGHGFSGLSDFYHPQKFASGVMLWDAIYGYHLFEIFKKNPSKFWTNRAGDQHFIERHLLPSQQGHQFIQNRWPDRVISYKVNMLKHKLKTVPETASVVCFHGRPKIWNCGNEDILQRVNQTQNLILG